MLLLIHLIIIPLLLGLPVVANSLTVSSSLESTSPDSLAPLLADLTKGDAPPAQALRAGDYAQALYFYQQELIKNPRNKVAFLGIVQVEILLKNFSYAQQQLTAYAARFGEDESFQIEQARLFALTSQPQNALDLVQVLLKKNPNNKALLAIKNDVLTHHNENLTGTRNPEFSEISVEDEQALGYLNQGDYKKAWLFFQKSYLTNPQDKVALLGMVQVTLFLAEYSQAIEYLQEYKRKFGEDSRYLTEKARYFAFLHKNEEAFTILAGLLRQDPKNVSLLEIKKYVQESPIQQVANLKKGGAPSAQELAHQARLNGEDPRLFVVAAQAYLSIQDRENAMRMIDHALVLAPNDMNILLLKADVSDVKTAYDVYQRLYATHKNSPKILLGLARKASYLNDLVASTKYYQRYTSLYPNDKQAWLEYAYVLSFSGNDRKAVRALDNYQRLFGTSDPYLIERARILANADRPAASLSIIDRLMPRYSNDYNLNYANTVALYYNNQPVEMFEGLDKVNRLQPDTTETKGLNSFIVTPYRNFLSINPYYSFDTDSVKTERLTTSGGYFLSPVTELLGNFTPERISASTASGLATYNGNTSVDLYSTSIGIARRFTPHLGATAWIGGAQPTQGKSSVIYEGDILTRLNDVTRVNFLVKRSYYDVSPLAVSLGVLQNLNQVDVLLAPCLQCYINLNTGYSTFTDSNSMNNTNVNLGANVLSNQWWSIRLGVGSEWQHFAKQLNDGYYSPDHYRYYNLNTNIYYKYNENIGYELSLALGRQKDETFTHSKPANDYALRAYYGIYQDWYLILSAAQSTRGRAIANNQNNNTYVVTAFDVQLTRRF